MLAISLSRIGIGLFQSISGPWVSTVRIEVSDFNKKNSDREEFSGKSNLKGPTLPVLAKNVNEDPEVVRKTLISFGFLNL